MKASDGHTHRRAIGRLGSFVRACSASADSGTLAHPPPLAGAGIARPMDGRSSERPRGGGSRGPRRLSNASSLASRVGWRDPPPLSSPTRGEEARWGDPRVNSSTGAGVRFARLAFVLALLALLATPARADFRVCNKTHALINIAVGTDAGEVFKTQGWWVATPGSCATPIRGPLKSRYVYLYATDIDGVDLLAGTATMCIDRGKFTAFGVENCWRRGLQAVTFAEIDTLDSSDWTTFLTDPRK
jgi:uncharacterized membrane protein